MNTSLQHALISDTRCLTETNFGFRRLDLINLEEKIG